MKRLLNILILSMVVVCACCAATPKKKIAKTSNNVYYVVVGSFSNLEGAREFLYSCPDVLNGPIYEADNKGVTSYRVCPSCFYTKKNAQKEAASLKNYLGINAWVWTSNGLAKCAEQGTALNGDPNPLTPQK